MRGSEILAEKDALERQHGPWSSHNIHLGDGVYTMGDGLYGPEAKLRRILQVIADVAPRPLASLRILDLACLEGMYAIECARHGATVLGIEGRRPNLERALFARRMLRLDNADFQLDDVRNLSVDKHGRFDIVLALGILYHLDDPGLFEVVDRIAGVCDHALIIDTRINLHAETPFHYQGAVYWGREVVEHPPGTGVARMEQRLWSSLNNETSVKLTRTSLLALLQRCGFTTVCECHVPEEPGKPRDRVTLVAIRGKPQQVISCPQLPDVPEPGSAERPARLVRFLRSTGRLVRRVLPAPVRRFLDGALGQQVVDWDRPRKQRRDPP